MVTQLLKVYKEYRIGYNKIEFLRINAQYKKLDDKKGKI